MIKIQAINMNKIASVIQNKKFVSREGKHEQYILGETQTEALDLQ